MYEHTNSCRRATVKTWSSLTKILSSILFSVRIWTLTSCDHQLIVGNSFQHHSSPAELVPHLVQVVSGLTELCFHVVTTALKLRLHSLHLVSGDWQATPQVLVLLLKDSGQQEQTGSEFRLIISGNSVLRSAKRTTLVCFKTALIQFKLNVCYRNSWIYSFPPINQQVLK